MFRTHILRAAAVAMIATSAAAGSTGPVSAAYLDSGTIVLAGLSLTVKIPAHMWQRHVVWCTKKYKSYRAWDNSWQATFNGPRRQCWSPYYRG